MEREGRKKEIKRHRMGPRGLVVLTTNGLFPRNYDRQLNLSKQKNKMSMCEVKTKKSLQS